MCKTYILGIVLAVLVLIQGCAPGYNSVVFATRSNIGLDAAVGIDADTAPANLEVAISRHEGVLMPTFEGGQTVPVMASFSSESNAITNFFWGVRSTFATGEAASTMSYLYDDKTPAKDKDIPYKRVTLKKKPIPQLPFGVKVHYLEEGDAKPVLFGTSTTLGVRVKWSGQTAQFPSSVNIGFKRREATWAPIGLGQNRITDNSKPDNSANKPYEADVPSLLATIDTDVAVSGSARLKYLQYFATGCAASNLSRQRAVREAMLKRADPLQMQIAEAGKVQRENNGKLIRQIAELYRSADAQKKAQIMTKAKGLTIVGESVNTDQDFLKALGEHTDAPPAITEKLKELVGVAASGS